MYVSNFKHQSRRQSLTSSRNSVNRKLLLNNNLSSSSWGREAIPAFTQHQQRAAVSIKVNNGRKREQSACLPQSPRQFLNALIMVKFDEFRIWIISLVVGLSVLVMQITPVFFNDWVNVIEPRTTNIKNNKGDNVEAYYDYKIGLFSACREIRQPLNLTEMDISEETLAELLKHEERTCVWSPSYTGDDLSDFSFAAIAILIRLTIPMVLHVLGCLLTMLGWMLSFCGYLKKDRKTFYSAMLYILGGLGVLIGILQLICVVDDEMHPRMKRDPAGEESKYNFNYGAGWVSAAFSFLPVQFCVYLQTTMFFGRFVSPLDKARIVPGIGELLNQVTVVRSRIHQLGRPAPIGGYSRGDGVRVNFAERSRRESRVSKDFSGSIPFASFLSENNAVPGDGTASSDAIDGIGGNNNDNFLSAYV